MPFDWDKDGDIDDWDFIMTDMVLFPEEWDDEEQQTVKQSNVKQPTGCGCSSAVITVVGVILLISSIMICII